MNIIALGCGLLFGLGLALSGMTDTSKVIGFLDITGQWNPSLMIVMASALCVTIPGFWFAKKQSKPLMSTTFNWPKNTVIDKPLLLGAALFGVGWGLYGYCPGPALASLPQLHVNNWLFVAAMIVGMVLHSKMFTARR